MASCKPIEPCHTGDCSGFDEVAALLPSGAIWNPDRGGVYGQYIAALGHIKTELNRLICGEWAEMNPCTSNRLLPYWQKVWCYPDCAPDTAESLCAWIELVEGDCQPGSLGFLRRAVEFVAPGAGITIELNGEVPLGCCTSSPCADNNRIIVTAPTEAYSWAAFESDGPLVLQDGENCRTYWIDEIECLRRFVIPIGTSLGYKTNPIGPDGQDIFGVPDANESELPEPIAINCSGACPTDDGL